MKDSNPSRFIANMTRPFEIMVKDLGHYAKVMDKWSSTLLQGILDLVQRVQEWFVDMTDRLKVSPISDSGDVLRRNPSGPSG